MYFYFGILHYDTYFCFGNFILQFKLSTVDKVPSRSFSSRIFLALLKLEYAFQVGWAIHFLKI